MPKEGIVQKLGGELACTKGLAKRPLTMDLSNREANSPETKETLRGRFPPAKTPPKERSPLDSDPAKAGEQEEYLEKWYEKAIRMAEVRILTPYPEGVKPEALKNGPAFPDKKWSGENDMSILCHLSSHAGLRHKNLELRISPVVAPDTNFLTNECRKPTTICVANRHHIPPASSEGLPTICGANCTNGATSAIPGAAFAVAAPGPTTPQPNAGWESAITSAEGDEGVTAAPHPDRPNEHGLITQGHQKTPATIAPTGGMNTTEHEEMPRASSTL
ncbi:uncharacterized protein EI90DRAFT_3133343 [Cantharellus anzutake]|uniref:uncharacterized protein n=1 Tax=Cantharellus anzutake TaxID=1750568 RepID=UPI001906C63B|nr:uncharacterized protein EI90DRAFT_3133343 [Cantharellus anzutake]KAF8318279.1 hypothetical protein EI90DRAFT_3133343 [Cantharellus anzutake]